MKSRTATDRVVSVALSMSGEQGPMQEKSVTRLPFVRAAGEFGRHACRFPVISNLFADTPKKDPFSGMGGLRLPAPGGGRVFDS
jgi:hypothetical protein